MKPLRIFLICQQSLRTHAVPAYSFWETYFKNGLEEAGHAWLESPEIDWAEGLDQPAGPAGSGWRDPAWNRLLAHLDGLRKGEPVDLVLSYLFPNQVEPAAVRQIRDWGIPCVNFYCDNVRDFTDVPQVFQPFDLHWVPEYEALEMYRRAGLAHVHAPMPAWIPPAWRTCDHPETFGVTFIGSIDEQREQLLAEALDRGAELEICGAGWGRASSAPVSNITANKLAGTLVNQFGFARRHGLGAVSRKVLSKFRRRVSADRFAAHLREPVLGVDGYLRVTQQSRIFLGVNRFPSVRHAFHKPPKYSRLRDIEAPMAGACYLTEYAPGLEAMYDLGREIEVYHTAEDLVEKIRQLNTDPVKRRQLRRLGQARALAEHTISESLKKVCSALGL